MPNFPGVGRQVPRGAEKDAGQMHQFAEGKVGQKDADQKEVNVKHRPDPFRNRGMEGHQSVGQCLGADRTAIPQPVPAEMDHGQHGQRAGPGG